MAPSSGLPCCILLPISHTHSATESHASTTAAALRGQRERSGGGRGVKIRFSFLRFSASSLSSSSSSTNSDEEERGCEDEAIPGNGVLYFCFISKNKMMMAIIDGADVVNNRMMD